MKVTRISEGFANNYLIPGVFLIIAGLICTVVGLNGTSSALWCGILLIIVAIALFSATSGVEIDTANKRYRKYGKFGPLLLGDWKQFPDTLYIRIEIHTETTSRNMAGAVPVPSHSTKSLTYDVVFVDTLNDSKQMYNFLKYRNAKKAGHLVAECLDVELQDLVAERLGRSRSRRR